jgi:ArsR family transcriptional regulator
MIRAQDAPPGALESSLRLLADPTRLRILALLGAEELSVGELSRALALSQSRVSNHLRLLREAGLLSERRAGTSRFLSANRPHAAGPLSQRLWSVLREELSGLASYEADRVRLAQVLAERHTSDAEIFDRMAGEWDKLAGAFETGCARERAAAHLLPRDLVAADLGCGTGYMATALLGRAARLICVDRSQAMLEEAHSRLTPLARGTRIELRRGELDRLPIEDAELDAAVAGLVLHHLPSLDAACAEMRRVLRPGGTLAILELAPHKEEWMRTELADRHLGLEPTEVLAALGRAGLVDLLLDPLEDRYRPRRQDADPDDASVSLSLYVVRARAPQT